MKKKSSGERRRRPPVRSKDTVGRVYVAQECFRGGMPHVTLEVNGVEMPLSKSFKRSGLIHFHFKKPAPNRKDKPRDE